MRRLFISLSILGIGMGAAWGQPQISGPQSGILGPGTYLVVGDVSVPVSQVLTIAPGTTFLHNGNYRWNIYGRLNAIGTEADSIVFCRREIVPAYRWIGLRFEIGASDSSVLEYCVVDDCYIPESTTPATLGGGICIQGVDLRIAHCRISNNRSHFDGGGIYAQNAQVTVDHCLIVGNKVDGSVHHGGGICLTNCPSATIEHNTILHNIADSG